MPKRYGQLVNKQLSHIIALYYKAQQAICSHLQ